MAQQRRQRRSNMQSSDSQLLLGDDNEHDSHNRRSSGWTSEWKSIVLLVFLYVLQGIPLGMGSAFTMFLQNKNISYVQQGIFSFVTWPFSLKVLWAPIVDSVHVKSFGRRKSWLVPVQYLIGIFLFTLSFKVDLWFSEGGHTPDIYFVTAVFFALNFLAATQDIAVDGWALTMLSRRNVGFASTCNSVGQTAGYFLGHVVFLALESKDFANKYIYSTPQPTGLVTMSGFMSFWAYTFFITTTLVAIFKREDELHDDDHMDVAESYSLAKKILLHKPVIATTLFLLTCFGITDGATSLKLIEAGVHKENLALLSIPLTPLQILLPLFLSKHVTGTTPLDLFTKVYPYRLLFGLVYAGLIKWTYSFNGEFPAYYYFVIVIIYALHQVCVYSCFVALMAFFARVSDPAIGGTYMTLLNTVCNFGTIWPNTLSMFALDYISQKSCSNSQQTCSKNEDCAEGSCETILDGFYIESFVSVVVGFIWLFAYGKGVVKYVQRLPQSEWAVRR